VKIKRDYGGDIEQDEGDRHGRARRMVRHTPNDSSAKIKFTITSFNGKYDPAAYLDWELEVEQKIHAMIFLLIPKLRLPLVNLLILL
jgi:hypothetical protein